MEDYVRRRHIEEGFEYVGTPHIAKEGLFYTSGHLPYYGEGMFPALDVDGQDYRLKAMNCPMHNLIFRSRQRSYRELPLRLFEFGHVYRNEKSGVIHGLTRVRGFAQDDSHSYVTPEQAPDEIRHLLAFVLSLLRDFGLDDFYLELSTRDDSKPDKFIGSDEDWEVATQVLADVATASGLELVPDPGGAAYYGPKISVQVTDALGRSWQMSTIQLDFILGLLQDFGLTDFYLELSTRDTEGEKSAKFIGSDEQWNAATKVLEDVATASGLELVADPGGAAFYGPKISVQARDAIGRTWQMSTIQYDFNQPSPDRFNLEYVAADGSRQQPVMIHSAKFGSIERFIGVLVEHYAGAFPPWLAPIQVQGIPIAERHHDYLAQIADRMRQQGLRAQVDFSDERMQKKIRNAQLQKVPFMVIAGDSDVEAGAVSFRYRDGRQDNGVPVDEAIARVAEAVAARVQV